MEFRQILWAVVVAVALAGAWAHAVVPPATSLRQKEQGSKESFSHRCLLTFDVEGKIYTSYSNLKLDSSKKQIRSEANFGWDGVSYNWKFIRLGQEVTFLIRQFDQQDIEPLAATTLVLPKMIRQPVHLRVFIPGAPFKWIHLRCDPLPELLAR